MGRRNGWRFDESLVYDQSRCLVREASAKFWSTRQQNLAPWFRVPDDFRLDRLPGRSSARHHKLNEWDKRSLAVNTRRNNRPADLVQSRPHTADTFPK